MKKHHTGDPPNAHKLGNVIHHRVIGAYPKIEDFY